MSPRARTDVNGQKTSANDELRKGQGCGETRNLTQRAPANSEINEKRKTNKMRSGTAIAIPGTSGDRAPVPEEVWDASV